MNQSKIPFKFTTEIAHSLGYVKSHANRAYIMPYIFLNILYVINLLIELKTFKPAYYRLILYC